MPDDADDFEAFFRPRKPAAADQPTAAWGGGDAVAPEGDGRGDWARTAALRAEQPAPPAGWDGRPTQEAWAATAALRAEPPTTPGPTAPAPPADWGAANEWAATAATPRPAEPAALTPADWVSPRQEPPRPEPGRGAGPAAEPGPPHETGPAQPGRPGGSGWPDTGWSGWSDSGWSDQGWSDSDWSGGQSGAGGDGPAVPPGRPSPDTWPGSPPAADGWPGSQPSADGWSAPPARPAPQSLPGQQPAGGTWTGAPGQPEWAGPQQAGPPGQPEWAGPQQGVAWTATPERPAPDARPGPQPGGGPWSGSPAGPGGEAWAGAPGQPAGDGWGGQPGQTREAWPTRQAWPATDATGPFRRPGASRPPLPPGPPRPGAASANRRWRTPAIIAAVLIIVVGGVYLIGRRGPARHAAHHARSGAAAAARPVASAAPTMLASGQVAARSAVPWHLVGKGWVLAQYSAGQAQPTLLYLVDPAGGRYLMRRWRGAWHLVDWSGDATRALLATTRGRRVVLRQLVLATGAATDFTLPPGVQPVSYTRPDGLNVIAVTAKGGVERFNLAGALQARLARGPAPGDPAGSTDGVTLALGGRNGLGLVSNAGGAIRPLPVPGVNPAIGCTPVRWWNTATVLAACAVTNSAGSQLWLVPVSKAKPSPLAPPPSAASDVNAWRLASGLYLQVVPPAPCAAETIDRAGSGGSITPVTVSGSPAASDRVLGVVRDKMLVLAENGCSGGSLLEVKPATGASVTLLAAPAGGPGVLAAVPYGTPNS